MLEALSALAVAAVAFVATNVDNLLVFAAFGAAGTVSRAGLGRGYALGLAGTLALILAAAALSRLIPVHLVGYLGLVPVVLGVRQLASRESAAGAARTSDGSRSEIAFVATTQLANSSDTIAVFAPLLAESAWLAAAFGLVAFVVMGAAWMWLIRAVGRMQRLRRLLERWAPSAGPLLMIAVGTYVLANTVTDTLPD